MGLIGFHRVLIVCAIALFFGYGGWEIINSRASGDFIHFVIGAGSLLAGIALTYYLRQLRD